MPRAADKRNDGWIGSTPMTVLIADDNPVSRKLLQGLLRQWGYEVVIAENGDEAWRLLDSEDGPLLAILDWMMPGMEGVEVCRRLRIKGKDRYVYVILLTAKSRHQDLVAGMDAGADDYITKPFESLELRARLRAGLRTVTLQRELVQAREALREQATRDGLTGIWNRTALFQILRQELARAERDRGSVSILMADLDHFKSVNDTYGHSVGDAVLAEAARRMHAAVRAYDSVGRYGGEEFLIVLPGCDSTTALSRAEQLRASIGNQEFSLPLATVHVTCSIGLATIVAPSPSHLDVLVRAADQALYAAKRAGRNRVEAAPSVSSQLQPVPAADCSTGTREPYGT